MAVPDRELEQQLLEAGTKLVDPPSSTDELLSLLDQVENCLSKVEQSPSTSMQSAIAPSLRALLDDKLFRHSVVDVKVRVAACISEITRITAPDAPYDDDQMKEVFQLIVSSFENLSDESSRSYKQRVSILETVARVRSCVVMLDLECDTLILEMFQHFLKAIRDYHPDSVFSSMEIIMSLVLEESEDISIDLLSPILASVKKDNEELLPICRKLGERVLKNCTTKVKPYLIKAVENLGISVHNYSSIVATICQKTSVSNEHNELPDAGKDVADESQSIRASVDEATQVNIEDPAEVASPEQMDHVADKSSISVMSNGTIQTGEAEALVDSNPIRNKEGNQTDQPAGVHEPVNEEHDSLDSEKTVSTEKNTELSTQRPGGKSKSLLKSTEQSEHFHDDKNESEIQSDIKSRGENVHDPFGKDSSAQALSLEEEKATDAKPSSSKLSKNESGLDAISPSPSESIPDESYSKSTGQKKKTKTSSKKDTPSASISKKESEEVTSPNAKLNKRSGKKVPSKALKENKTVITKDASKNESDTASDSEAKVFEHSLKKADGKTENNGGSSLKSSGDKKSQGKGKAISGKNAAKSSKMEDEKEILSSTKSTSKSAKDEDDSEETPKNRSKRKLTPGKEKGSGTKDHSEILVGSKIKVWWPDDQMFYEGVVESFDRRTKKHKVSYTDGDVETLNLKSEKWEFIEDLSESGQGQAINETSPDMPQKKKTELNSGDSSKQGKSDVSAKKGEIGSSKSKGTALKPVKNRSNNKSHDKSLNSSKSKDNIKSKDLSSSTPKAPTKSKPDTPIKSSKSKQETSKGKTPKSGDKSGINRAMKGKSSTLKGKESEDVEDRSSDSEKTLESTKGKASSKSQGQGSRAGTGKKRKKRN